MPKWAFVPKNIVDVAQIKSGCRIKPKPFSALTVLLLLLLFFPL
jgi:hypothetical protein